ncbi:hypothetical protein [Lichenifustis flavocetrariae]|uniref:Uncharacterized protein n=1 Tax=Lichenifustis flavocetrariae TaxID=2949735 RepID=A0AA42CM27_9HYPH|nr:hypothetical protein [Lichenifustis flavocetrariae]MCW6512123.1 hypothetical protein [Lichenifustis flavocetrariae]
MRRLLLSILGIFDAFFAGVRNAIFGVPQPTVLDTATADAIAEQSVGHRALADLHAAIDAERLKADALDRRAAVTAPAAAAPVQVPQPMPDPERWYRVLASSGDVSAFAFGTESEAQEYWEVGGDGWRVEPVTEAEDVFVLETIKGSGGSLRGARVKSLADELSDWRSERSSSFN